MSWFGKKYFKVSLEKRLSEKEKEEDEVLWLKCKACHELVFKRRVNENHNICPLCGEYFFLTAQERIALLVDEGSFRDISRPLAAADPLRFVDTKPYPQRLEEAFEATGLSDAVIVGEAAIGGTRVILAVMDFRFIGGSMGSVAGEQISHAIRCAARRKCPFILVAASGGARMQEGILSLMQMAKTAAARRLLEEAPVPFVSIMTYPTTAGVQASIASLGDLILAEKGALIGFTGRRVIEETLKETLPDDFQTDRFALAHGLVDRVVSRGRMREELIQLLSFFTFAREGTPAPADAGLNRHRVRRQNESERPRSEEARKSARRALLEQLETLKALSAQDGLAEELGPQIARLERVLAQGHVPDRDRDQDQGRADGAEDDWARVQMARHPQRPCALDYIRRIFTDFYELHGDRLFGDDPAMVCGLARLDGRSVAVVAQQKGREPQERRARRHGLAHPEGYRKALRVMRLAERFGFPVVSLVDTQGAYPGRGAEERNIGGALAQNIYAMSALRVPIVVAILGEGGSGGALGIGVGDRVLMLENAYYSVITPEGCAAILWRDRAKAPEAARALKLTAPHLLELGAVDEVVPEPPGGAHRDPDRAAALLGEALRRHLAALQGLEGETLRRRRFRRLQRFGEYNVVHEVIEVAEADSATPTQGGEPDGGSSR